MSWSRALYETYENCKGVVTIDKEHPDAVPLSPLFHDLKQVGYEFFIDEDSNFKPGAASKIDAICIVPTSEASEGRVDQNLHPHRFLMTSNIWRAITVIMSVTKNRARILKNI